ncbi:MAG: hypothetical protein KDE27_18995 [Planctomycetes bacterium]|nr:hypothetical protein [Planctomycetota bacterium]
MRSVFPLCCVTLAGLGLALVIAPREVAPPPAVDARPATGGEPTGSQAATAVHGDGTTAAVAPPMDRRAAPASGTDALLVVDARDRSPLSGATVRFAADHDNTIQWSSATTAADGRAPLPAATPIAVAITADGHVPTLAAWRPDGDATFALQPAAALRLRFVDADGEPVAGVGVRVLPPLERGAAWAADWREAADASRWPGAPLGTSAAELQRRLREGRPLSDGRFVAAAAGLQPERWSSLRVSSGAGVVEFADLWPGSSWRWAVDSQHAVDVEPPHESLGTLVGDAVRLGTGQRLRDLSGPLSLTSGETTTIEVRAQTFGAIVGRITVPDAALRPQIRLYHLGAVENGNGRGAASVTQSGYTTTDVDGTFGFLGVRPGPKIVRAHWRDTDTSYAFATRTVLLAAGERCDLGEVTPLAGEVALRVRLADRSGATLPPERVLGDADPRAPVLIEAWRERGLLVDSVFDLVPVPLGREVRLRGLPAGTLGVRAQLGSAWPALSDGRRIVEAPMTEVALPSDRPVDLTLTVETRVERRLDVLTPDGSAPALELWLRPTRGGNASRMRLRAANGTGVRQVALTVLAEPHELLLFTPSADDGLGLAAITRVDFTADQPQAVRLSTAAAIAGVCRAADGTPQPERTVHYTIDGWRCEDQPAWLFESRTDAEGRFLLSGLPAHTALRGSRPGSALQSPAAGSLASVQLVLAK